MLSRIFALSLTALVATVGGTARADFDDTFSAPSPATSGIVDESTPFSVTTAVNSDLMRTATATVLQDGTTLSGARVGTASGQSVFAFGLGSGAVGFAGLNYAYSSPQDLSSSGTDFILSFTLVDKDVPFAVTLTDNTGTSSTQSTVAVEGGATYTFSMSSFAGIDLSNISTIDVAINDGPGSVSASDFTLDRVRIATPTPNNPVPAPAALILFGIGGASLALIRKFRGQPAIA